MDKDFVECNSTNCPKVDFYMIHQFLNSQNFGEIAGSSKDQRSSRPNYGDKAIGRVQLKRAGSFCCVKAKITPEHKIRAKPYSVMCTIDEENEEVVSAECDDCPASLGGCKHRIAFIMWLHRRSEEPSPTEVTSYWKKSILSSAGIAPIEINKLSGRGADTYFMPTTSVIEMFKTKVKSQSSSWSVCNVFNSNINVCDIHTLVKESFDDFQSSIREELTDEAIKKLEKETRGQASSEKWHLAHYGRITASKFYNAAHCRTAEGALLNTILGRKTPQTAAMKRGSELEDDVYLLVKNKLKDVRKCGLFLSKKYPLFGASPDGIGKEYVLEIKCPSSEKTVNNYHKDEKLHPKYELQIQLQMAMTERKKGYFIIADPQFEKNSQFTMIEVSFNARLLNENVDKAIIFYREKVFPHLH